MANKKKAFERGRTVRIGRRKSNEISCEINPHISRDDHVRIIREMNGTARFEDLKNSVGVYVNGVRARTKTLEMFDEIYFMGLSIIYLGDCLAIRQLNMSTVLPDAPAPARKQEKKDERKIFVSSPRIVRSLDERIVEIDAPPSLSQQEPLPMLLQIGPSATMGIMMMGSLGVSIYSALTGTGGTAALVSSGIMLAGMLATSLIWPSMMRRYQNKKAEEQKRTSKASYRRYLAEKEQLVMSLRDETVRILNENLLPDPKMLCGFMKSDRAEVRLWERTAEDADFLDVRLGKGERPFQVDIRIPRTGFRIVEDELYRLPEEFRDKYEVLPDVPMAINLRKNPSVGLIGNYIDVQHVIDEIILNLSALHSYEEVKIVILSSPDKVGRYEKYQDIPHIWSTDRKIRYFASRPDEIHILLTYFEELFAERQHEKEERFQEKSALPHFVFVVTDPGILEGESVGRFLQDPKQGTGLSAVFAYGEFSDLPKSCGCIIQADDRHSGFYIKNEN
ncbi:MAG: FHA domain-containing protein, partial [Erysipelotrichaceae bacterium]|nr:FHA domain-containing protein [Erysipelotrichaceae bacterium]